MRPCTTLAAAIGVPSLLVLLAGLAHADPQAVSQRLLDGHLSAAEAAAAWRTAGVAPREAAAGFRKLLPLEQGPLEDHQAPLVDDFGRETDVRVGMPDGPCADGRYRVLIMLHGLGGDSKQGFKEVRAFAPPGTIVVATSAKLPPEANEAEDLKRLGGAATPITKQLKRWWSYQPGAFPLRALDYLKRRYPLDLDRVLVVGISMGGFGCWNLGLRYHDRFSGLVPLAGGISRAEYLFRRDEHTRKLLDNVSMVPVFFVHGGADFVVPVTFDRWTVRDLIQRGLDYRYHELDGAGHVVNPFTADPALCKELVSWMTQRERDPHPRKVIHRALGTYHGQAYWARMDRITGSSGCVLAEVTQPNAITVQTESVEQLTLYLDPTLHDVDAPVTVTWNGQVVHRGPVPASHEAVAETFARCHDPALVYAHALTLTPAGVVSPEASSEEPARPERPARFFQVR